MISMLLKWLKVGVFVLIGAFLLLWLVFPLWYLVLRFYPFGNSESYNRFYAFKENAIFRQIYKAGFAKPISNLFPKDIVLFYYPTNKNQLAVKQDVLAKGSQFQACGKFVSLKNNHDQSLDLTSIDLSMDYGKNGTFLFSQMESYLFIPVSFDFNKLTLKAARAYDLETNLFPGDRVCLAFIAGNEGDKSTIVYITKLPSSQFLVDSIK
jgi:hypothetical protein